MSLLDQFRDKMNRRWVTVAVAIAYAPFILGMQYSKHKWLITRPETLWNYLPILHSEIALYGCCAALLAAVTRSALAGFGILTLYYLLSFFDSIAWSVMARPFHPQDVLRALELARYYGEFVSAENVGVKRLIYAAVPFMTASTLLFLRMRRGSLELKDHPRLAPLLGAAGGLAAACCLLLAPLSLSQNYLHYNSVIRMGKQIYYDWSFAQLRLSDAEKRRLFGPVPARGGTAGKKMNVILFVLETAPADLYPDPAPALERRARRMGWVVQTMPEHYTTYPESDRSNLSIMSGNYPCLNRGTEWVYTFDYGAPLPKVLAAHGYRTHLLSVAPLAFHNGNVMMRNLGFQKLHESGISLEAHAAAKSQKRLLDRTILYRADEELLEKALGIIRDGREKPYLLAFLPQSSHAPFQIPPGYRGSTGQRELLEANAKWQLGLVLRMMRGVEESGEAEKTIVVIVGDHGLRHPAESPLFQDQTRLNPLTFKVRAAWSLPKGLPPLQPGASSHIDIAPTLLDLLRISYDPENYHGRSLLSTTARSIFFLGGEYLPVSGFLTNGWYFMENTNRDLVLRNSRFRFEEKAPGAEEVRERSLRNGISRDLFLVQGLLTH